LNHLSATKIDIFSHILPVKYKEALYKVASGGHLSRRLIERLEFLPTLFDLDHRFRIMDKYEGLRQVLTISSLPIEEMADSQKTVDLARIANDEMAELVLKYPDRFAAAAACLPMNDMDAALVELDRAIKNLKLSGVQLPTPINDRPLDSPEFLPFYEKMSEYDMPIWLHPRRAPNYADYRTENESKYWIFSIFGWPYETTAAMTRLVFSGILEKFPNLKFITHHCGAMVPFFEQRIACLYDLAKSRQEVTQLGLTKNPIEYFKMFYNDTAVYGSMPALMCAYAFCGSEYMLFGTDFPHDDQFGDRFTRQTIDSIEKMAISDSDKKKIFADNARRLLHLSLP